MRDVRCSRKLLQTSVRLGLALAVCLCSAASAETKTATTSIGIKVERHTAVYLPSPDSGVGWASFRESDRSDHPRALGNDEAHLTFSGDSSGVARASRVGSPQRVVVTVFEP